MATVSVVIPTYNRARWLPETVASVLGQSVPPLEVLIVDDGSTDDTATVCAGMPPPVRYLRQANAGVGAARNRGIREARGDFVALVDSDDVWEPAKLEAQLELHRCFPDTGWSVTNHVTIGLDGQALPGRQGFVRGFGVFDAVGMAPEAFFDRWFRRGEITAAGTRHTVFVGDAYTPLFYGNFASPTCVMIRRSLLEQAGGFDESLRLAEETEFFHRLSASAPLGILMTPLFRWRVGQTVSLVSAGNVAPLIENALMSLDRAAALRSPLPAEARAAWAAGRQRLLLDLAYTELSGLRGREARAALRRARAAGARATMRSTGILAASYVPPAVLRMLHGLKRRLRR